MEFSIRELANLVIGLTGSKSQLAHHTLPQDDLRQRQPDISHAQEFLDWTPTTTLKEGLVKTIAYFDALLSDERTKEILLSVDLR